MDYIRKIAAFIMTALMFVATTSIVLSAHLCSDELYSFALYEHASEKTASCCGSHSSHTGENSATGGIAFYNGNHCCSSMILDARGVDIVYPSTGLREIEYQPLVLQLDIFDYISLPDADIQGPVFKPDILKYANRDIPVLVQSFLL